MFDTKFLDSFIGVSSGGKGPSEDIKELIIKATDSHVSNVEIRPEDTGDSVLLGFDDNFVDTSDFDLGL